MPCRSPCNRSINRLARLRSYRWSGLNEMFWRALRPQGTSEQRAQGKARPSSLRCVVDTETGTDTVTKLTHTLPPYSSLCAFAASEAARAVWRQGSAMSSTSTPTDRAAPQQRARRLPLPRSSTRAIRSRPQAAPPRALPELAHQRYRFCSTSLCGLATHPTAIRERDFPFYKWSFPSSQVLFTIAATELILLTDVPCMF